MGLSARMFYDSHHDRIVRVTYEGGYLCHNTGNRVYIAYVVGSDESYEVFMSDLEEISPLEALARLGAEQGGLVVDGGNKPEQVAEVD